MSGAQAGALRLGAPGGNDGVRSPDEVRIIKEMALQEVEDFLQLHQIETSAARELKNEPPHVSLAVIDRGTLKACNNPSGALVARIRDAKRGLLAVAAPMRPAGSPSLDPDANELDRFLSENLIDQAGIVALRAESKEIQKAVVAKGGLTRSTNPSASLMARIRNCKSEAFGGPPSSTPSTTPNGPPSFSPPPPPPPALLPRSTVDSSSFAVQSPSTAPIGDDSLANAALKAIEKLNAASTRDSPAISNESKENDSSAMVNTLSNGEDNTLQQEAFKAMQAIHFSEL